MPKQRGAFACLYNDKNKEKGRYFGLVFFLSKNLNSINNHLLSSIAGLSNSWWYSCIKRIAFLC